MPVLRTTMFLLIALAGLSTALLKPRVVGAEIAPVPTTTLVKRVDPSRSSFYACDEANWGGRCQWFQMPMGECLNFELLWADRISSVGPDPGYTCQVYMCVSPKSVEGDLPNDGNRDSNCDGEVKSYQYPGVSDLEDEEGDWNNRISSVKCELTDSMENQGMYTVAPLHFHAYGTSSRCRRRSVARHEHDLDDFVRELHDGDGQPTSDLRVRQTLRRERWW